MQVSLPSAPKCPSQEEDSEFGAKRRIPHWDKKYDIERKRKGKRGHGINLLWGQRDACSTPYPTHIDTLLASLMKHSVNGGSSSSSSSSSSSEEVMSGIMQLNENALEAARARVRCYGKNPKHWRVWLPSDVWAKFSMLKSVAAPRGTTSVEFVEMLIQLQELRRDGMIDMVGFLDFTPTLQPIYTSCSTPTRPTPPPRNASCQKPPSPANSVSPLEEYKGAQSPVASSVHERSLSISSATISNLLSEYFTQTSLERQYPSPVGPPTAKSELESPTLKVSVPPTRRNTLASPLSAGIATGSTLTALASGVMPLSVTTSGRRPLPAPTTGIIPSPTMMLSSTMMPLAPTTLAAFLDDGFAFPAYSPANSSSPLSVSLPDSLFYPTASPLTPGAAPQISVSMGGSATQTTVRTDDFAYALDVVHNTLPASSNDGLLASMRGVLYPMVPLNHPEHSRQQLFRAAVARNSRVFADIKTGGGGSGDSKNHADTSQALAKAQRLAGELPLGPESAEETAREKLDAGLSAIARGMEKRVSRVAEKLKGTVVRPEVCRDGKTLETMSRGIVEYQVLAELLNLLVRAYGAPRQTAPVRVQAEKGKSKEIEQILGLTLDVQSLGLVGQEAKKVSSASREKAALALASAQSGRIGGKKSASATTAFAGGVKADLHSLVTTWWTGTQDVKSLKSLFSENHASPRRTLEMILRVYAESGSWKKAYAAEIMSEALHLVVSEKLIPSVALIPQALMAQRRRLDESAVPYVFDTLFRVMVLKRIVRYEDWIMCCENEIGSEQEFLDTDGSYAATMDEIRRPVATLTVGDDLYHW